MGIGAEGEIVQDRLTVVLCVNVLGKFEYLLVIGKRAKHRCFELIDQANLQVKCTYNVKAWMNTFLFCDWVRAFDKKMKIEN